MHRFSKTALRWDISNTRQNTTIKTYLEENRIVRAFFFFSFLLPVAGSPINTMWHSERLRSVCEWLSWAALLLLLNNSVRNEGSRVHFIPFTWVFCQGGFSFRNSNFSFLVEKSHQYLEMILGHLYFSWAMPVSHGPSHPGTPVMILTSSWKQCLGSSLNSPETQI